MSNYWMVCNLPFYVCSLSKGDTWSTHSTYSKLHSHMSSATIAFNILNSSCRANAAGIVETKLLFLTIREDGENTLRYSSANPSIVDTMSFYFNVQEVLVT